MAHHWLHKSILSLKSWLFTPATKADRFARAVEVGVDAFIIDLEDAVAPSAKKEARATALRYLAQISADHLPCALRINSPHTKFGLDDLQDLLSSSPVLACGSSRANGAALDGWLLFCFSPVASVSC
jgi:(S)-citramalyl-CoA lyase